jgi:hypothetical protein
MQFAQEDNRSQLEKDIEAQCFTKLRRWAHDVVDLHQMAELSNRRAADVLISSLLTGLVHTLADLRVDPVDAGNLVEKAMRHQYLKGGRNEFPVEIVKKKN